MTFDRFTIDQLAGDLLPGAGAEQKIATGFHRNTLTNREGGTDKEQFRVEAVVDRVNTTSQVWLGLTMGCAQCHDHKYDPLSQRDFYRMFAFFNSDVEKDITVPGGKARTLALGNLRKTHVLIRGDFLRPGVEVQADVPGILPDLPAVQTKSPTRMDLAHWLMSNENPLTARVISNWVWQKYFGRGLVATPEDFGVRGETPSHPQLLDFLARELQRMNWDLHAFHKLIVTSATYRQSSKARPELASTDPYNKLLSHQNRFRLEAEIIRDNALTVSGLLSRKIGGPSVKPPQPKGVSDVTYAGRAKWVVSKGENKYRRGMYTWFQRTSPYAMLLTFDAPESTVCCIRREESNTPLQALTLLNDAVFVECSQALARRVLTEQARGSGDDRIQHLFRLCLARDPSDREMEILRRLQVQFVANCRKNPKTSTALIGNFRCKEWSVPENAAWVALARTVMNLDEFITRE